MIARVLHVSDLHIGRPETPQTYAALGELASRVQPELLIATGDMAHRGRRAQLERAQELLGELALPLLAVPGNHDIPYTFPARFTRTFEEWERAFGDTEPVYSSARLFVAGLNSVRAWRQQGGSLPSDRLARAVGRLEDAPATALRIVALHHHLAAPPWRAKRKRPLKGRHHVLEALAAAGAELIVGGHVHQAGIAERREFEALEGTASSLVLVTVSGFGRPRPGRRGEARGVNVYESDDDSLTVTTHAWDGLGFAEIGQRSFRRG